MPILHGHFGPADGPLQLVRVSITREDAARRRRTGQAVLPPIEVTALLDTGAEASCIDPSIAMRLGLEPKDITLSNAPGVEGLGFNWLYEVDLAVLHPSGQRSLHLTMPGVEVVELPLNARGCEVILGRDVLASCVLIYDGTAGAFTLSY